MRRPAWRALAVLATLALSAPPAQATAVAQILVGTGDTAPNGGVIEFVDGDTTPFALNDAGQVGLLARVRLNPAVTRDGVFRAEAGGLVELARQGGAAPGAQGGTFEFVNNVKIDSAGRVSFLGVTSAGNGIFRGDGTGVEATIRVPTPYPPGGFLTDLGIGQYAINDAGETLFLATISNPNPAPALHRTDGSTLATLLKNGDPRPGGGSFALTQVVNNLNESGQTPVNSSVGVYRTDGFETVKIAADGDAAPDSGGSSFTNFVVPRVDEAGRVVFRSVLAGGDASTGLHRGDGSTLETLATDLTAAPGGGTFAGFLNDFRINDAGDVAFRSFISGSDSTRGVFRTDGSNLVTIAREGDPNPRGDGSFSDTFATKGITDTGTVAFFATSFLPDIGINGSFRTGIYLGDGQETITLLRSIDLVDGRFVGAIDGDSVAANRHGQVAVAVRLSNAPSPGADSVALLLTPDLHWRTAGDGAWDDTGNWTVSLRPGEPHRVFIDPDTDATVDGPADAVTVKHLTIGGGAGQATLALGPGTLGATDGVTVAANGTLAGTGIVVGDVHNAGWVAPGSSAGTVTVDGDYTQDATGVLTLEIVLTDEFDLLQILGTAFLDGLLEVAVDAGYAATASLGDSFTVMTWAGREGAFADIDGLYFAPGLRFAAVYGDTGLSLVVAAAVPEPVGLPLLALGLALVAFGRLWWPRNAEGMR